MSPSENEEPSIGSKAFSIVADHLKTEISAENSALAEEISHFEQLCEHLNSVEIRIGANEDQRSIPTRHGLMGADIIVKDGHASVLFTVNGKDGVTLPLAELAGPTGQASVFVSKQRVGAFPSRFGPIVAEGDTTGSLDVKLIDAATKVSLQGRVDDLCNGDYELIRKELRDETRSNSDISNALSMYLKNGVGMNSPDATFKLDFIEMHLNSKRRGSLMNTILRLKRCFIYQREKDVKLNREHMQTAEKILDNNEIRLEENEAILSMIEENEVLLSGIIERDEFNEDDGEIDYDEVTLSDLSEAEYELDEEDIKAINLNIDRVRQEIVEVRGNIEKCKQLCDRDEADLKELGREVSMLFAELVPDYVQYVKSPEGELRDLVFSIGSSSGNRKILNDNHSLKLHQHTLLNLKETAGQIEIFYHRGNMDSTSENKEERLSIRLDSGNEKEDHLVLDYLMIDHVWSISLPHIEVVANKLHSFDVHLSGVSLMNNGLRNTVANMVHEFQVHTSYVILVCGSGLILLGGFHFKSRESEEETVANESFPRIVHNFFNRRRNTTKLPDDCTFVPIRLQFTRAIADNLKMLGCNITDS